MERKFLVVDDSSTMRKVLKKILLMCKIKDLTILEAENGKDAFFQIASNKIDLVLTDLNMPIMDGYTLIHKIKERQIFSNIPIVVLTSETREEELSEIKNLGIQGILVKPFRPEIIKELIFDILHLEENDVDTNIAGDDF